MERLGNIYSHGAAIDPEKAAILAIASVNDALTKKHVDASEARAVSFRNGRVKIIVRHSAIGATLMSESAEIINLANNKLTQRSSRPLINEIGYQVSL